LIKNSKNFFSKDEQQLIVEAIKTAELNTSGEIRVHIENYCFGNSLVKAEKIFSKLGMQNTKDRNGILIYIAAVSRKMAIVGDKGIHEKLGKEYWDKIVNGILESFRTNTKGEGLAKGIIDCGEQLKKHFPYASDDKNELNDSISFKA
jgi:uncharacterized membrane protein